jgi:hypothetical protein
LEEYVEDRLRFEDEPYWLFVDASDELRWNTFSYFPEAHYNKEITERIVEETQNELLPDGGSSDLHSDGRRSTVYYWLNPDTGAALYHTQVNGDEANPFFGSEQRAEQYLENRAEDNQGRYEDLSLYKARVDKVGDAVDVLTDQSGLADFSPSE